MCRQQSHALRLKKTKKKKKKEMAAWKLALEGPVLSVKDTQQTLNKTLAAAKRCTREVTVAVFKRWII